MKYLNFVFTYFVLVAVWGCSSKELTLSYYEIAVKEFYRNEGQRNTIKWDIDAPRSLEDSLIYITLYSLLESHIGDSIPTNYFLLKNDRFYELSRKDSLHPLNFMFFNYYVTPKEKYFQFQEAANMILQNENFFNRRIFGTNPNGVVIPLN